MPAQLPIAASGYVSGVGADGLGGAPPDDWYSVNVEAGQSLVLQTSTPSDQGGQFPNTASMEVYLYDTYGNLVAVGTKEPDGRNVELTFNAPVSGSYRIQVVEDPGGEGEYYLSVNTASYPSGGISGQVFNDLTGSGTFVPGDPGLAGWEVDVLNSSDVLVASQLTDSNGDFDFEGLDPGTYTVEEFLPTGLDTDRRLAQSHRAPSPRRWSPVPPSLVSGSAISRTSRSVVRSLTTWTATASPRSRVSPASRAGPSTSWTRPAT